ncbi:hypothetical protein CspHIS471_0206640 [Cutaneotrichosporon sp. HIS471]|nr:hypothetical protein CspHIS471_0206640 [Cutaneotrichosporon sp. HIS471]
MKLNRDVSENPTSGGLTEVIDAERDSDIKKDTQSDLRLMAILSALRNGYLPSNQQLDGWLGRLSTCLESTRQDGLSDETVTALGATKALTDTVRQVLREKDGDELLQDTLSMAWFETRRGSHRPPDQHAFSGPSARNEIPASQADRSFESDLARDVDAAAREGAERDGELREAVGYIRTLGTILFTNPELRAAITELTALAPKNGTDVVGAEGQDQDENALSTANNKGEAAPSADAGASSSDAVDDWRNADDFHIPGGFGDPDSGWDDDSDVFVDAETSVTLDPRVTAFLRRLRGAIASMQEQEGYTGAMTWLLDTFAAYEFEVVAQTHPELAPEYHTQPRMTPTRRILANLVTLWERFAANRSIGPIQQSINKLYAYILEDKAARGLSVQFDFFLRKVFLEKGYVSTDACVVRAAQLWDDLSAWLSNEAYAAQWNAVWAGMEHFVGVGQGFDIKSHQPKLRGWFSEDPLTVELDARWTAFTNALLLDNGRLAFKRGLWSELGQLAASGINWRGFITLPRMELVTPNVELVLENIHLSLANLFPSIIDFQVHDHTRFSPFAELRTSCEAATKTRLQIQAEQIQADIRDSPLSLRFAKLGLADQGRANIALTRRGIWFDVELEFDTHPNAEHVVQARRIDIGIDELSLVAKGTKRDGLYAVLLPTLGAPFLKWRLTSSWKLKLAKGIQQLDSELCRLRDSLNEKKERRTTGNSDSRASTRLFKVLAQRLQELQTVAAEQAAKKSRAIRAYRRRRKKSSASVSDSSQGNSATSSEDEEASSSDEEVGPGEPEPLRGFRISFALADAILPQVTADPEQSLLYRREQAEKAVRRSPLHPRGFASSMRCSATATGLGQSGLGGRPWRSPVFNSTN